MEQQLLYGIHPVLEQLRSGRPVSSIYLALKRGDQDAEEICYLATHQKITLKRVHHVELDRIAGTTKHQGVAAMAVCTPCPDLESLLAISAQRGEPPFLFLLDSVEDPRNVGAIIRTAEAAGAHGLILPKRRASGLSPVVAKTSAGAISHLPIVRVTNLSQTIDQLKKESTWVVGLDVRGMTPYLQSDFQDGVAIVVGSEGEGIHRKILERCDQVVSLPMRGVVQSLNVSVAVGIIAYEVLRQRSTKGNRS
jgi:23S rRNA (guanosine2251-2'-O)-methyltransferase